MDTDDEPLIMDGSCPLTTQPTPVVQPYFDNPPPGYYPPSSPYGPVPGAPINHHTTTTVIINQPSPMTVAGPRLWSSDLCSCCDDMGICCLGLFCPCILGVQLATDMGESSCLPCCVSGWLMGLRIKMRTQNNIQGSIMNDSCVTCFCGICSLCQMAREMELIKSSFRVRH